MIKLKTMILGTVENEEYKKKYTRENEKSKHMSEREDRLDLSLNNARPLFYYEVLIMKDNSRQVHCLYEDATLIVHDKNDGKIITIMLLGRKKLAEYMRVAEEYVSEYPATQRCARQHERLYGKKSEKITEETLRDIKKRKINYMKKR